MTILASETRTFANAGHDLITALMAALQPEQREKYELFTMAGAPVALTVRWIDNRVEVRAGLTPDDSEPLTIYAVDFNRTAEGLQ